MAMPVTMAPPIPDPRPPPVEGPALCEGEGPWWWWWTTVVLVGAGGAGVGALLEALLPPKPELEPELEFPPIKEQKGKGLFTHVGKVTYLLWACLLLSCLFN